MKVTICKYVPAYRSDRAVVLCNPLTSRNTCSNPKSRWVSLSELNPLFACRTMCASDGLCSSHNQKYQIRASFVSVCTCRGLFWSCFFSKLSYRLPKIPTIFQTEDTLRQMSDDATSCSLFSQFSPHTFFIKFLLLIFNTSAFLIAVRS